MRSPLILLLKVYFDEEMIGDRSVLRTGLHSRGPEAAEPTRLEFVNLLRSRTMTRDEFLDVASAYFEDDAELYEALEEAYRFFFDDEPPAPAR